MALVFCGRQGLPVYLATPCRTGVGLGVRWGGTGCTLLGMLLPVAAQCSGLQVRPPMLRCELTPRRSQPIPVSNTVLQA